MAEKNDKESKNKAEKEITEIANFLSNAKPKQSPQEKPKTEENKKKEKKFSIKKIVGGFIVSLILIFIVYRIFFAKREKRIFTSPIPFVYPTKCLQYFESFADSSEKSNILVYYGEKGFGKSRFLSIAEEKLIEKDYLVIKCDFTSLTNESTQNDVREIIKDSIVDSINKAQKQHYSQVKKSLSIVESLQQTTGLKAEPVYGGIKDQTMRTVASLLCSLVDAIEFNAPFASALFTALDACGPTVFIANEPQKAAKTGSAIFKAIFNELMKTSAGSNNVGCIAEISDVEYVKERINLEHIEFIEMGEFSSDEALKYLKGTFNARNILELYSAFGGCGRLFARVYEQLRNAKISFKDALENVKKIAIAEKQRL
jgi:hypothetical protein